MSARTFLTLLTGVFAVLVAPSLAQAQSKLTGKQQCAKPNPEYMVAVADRANHTMMLRGQKCTWTQGEMNGDRLKDGDDTMTSDLMGNRSREHCYGVGTTASGDKYYLRFDSTRTLKNNAPVSAQSRADPF